MALVTVVGFDFVIHDPQIDGRVWVDETQALSDGTTREYTYLSAPDADFKAIAQGRSADINAALATQE